MTNGFDTGGDKGANILAEMIVSKEKPFAVDVGEVVGVNEAFFDLLLTGFAVAEFELLPGGGGFGQGIERSQIKDGLGAGAKGNALLEIG